jgi:nitrogen PTS system EIIA component
MFVPPDHIIPELRATVRDAAIRELIRHLIQVGSIPAESEEELVAACREREKTMTTGVGFGVALPHARSECVRERVVALGKSKAGVDFASMDGRKIHSVFLVISPQGSSFPSS